MAQTETDWMTRRARRLHRFVGRVLGTTGARAERAEYADDVAWWRDRSWMEPYRKFLVRDRHSPDQDETRILDRRFQLMRFAEATAKVPGSTAECGVYRGIGSAIICQTLRNHFAPGDRHFGFDSFQGISAPKEQDRLPDRAVWKEGQLKTDLDSTAAMLAEFSHCQLVPGWIPTTFPIAAEHRFRLVHIDVDLYEPTLASLEFFYPRLNPGGMIVLDDHGFAGCPGARRAALEYFADKVDPVLDLATGQGLVIKSGR
jgi:O-methyltransferase